MKKYAQAGICVYTILMSDLLMAECPQSMPQTVLEDCITYERAGSTFPTSDYARLDMYNEWLNEQRSTAKDRQVGMSSMEISPMEKK